MKKDKIKSYAGYVAKTHLQDNYNINECNYQEFKAGGGYI